MTREERITAFLAASGYAASDATPLAQDASFRRYLRVAGTPPAVLMDAPPPEDVRPFLRIAAHLRRLGLSVPQIIAADASDGLLLEEDLGDDLLSTLLDRALVPAERLVDAAVDALLVLQRAAAPAPADFRATLPVWDAAAMAQAAMGTLFDWWWPACFGEPAPAAARADIAGALAAMLAPLQAGPRCFVHRDFFAGNLLWLPQRAGPARIGIIDFQGAAVGHPAYDLVSLLQDARRDIPAALQHRALQRYLAARPDLHPAAFHAAFTVCAVQRHLRVACQWVRLAQRDGRPQYLAYGPRTWRLLNDALQLPAAAALAAAFDRWVPAALRGNPPEPDASNRPPPSQTPTLSPQGRSPRIAARNLLRPRPDVAATTSSAGPDT